MNEPATKRSSPAAPTRPAAEPLRRVPKARAGDPYAQEARRRRLKIAAVCGGILVVIASLAAWHVRSAAAHYERGREALETKRYSLAIQEFNAARIVVFPYRDAEDLAAEAATALTAGMEQEAELLARLEAAVRRDIELADASLTKGDAAAAEEALADARERVPDGPFSGESLTRALVEALARKLTSTCRGALETGRWGVAGHCARGLLLIDPDSAVALRLKERVRRATILEARLDRAREAADRGQWTRALTIARGVLASWPGFPGARSVVERARTALTPEPPQPETTATPAETPPPPVTPPAPPPP